MRLGMFTCGYQREPLEKAFADARQFGYDYIELWGGRPHAFAPDLKAGGAAFYDGDIGGSPAEIEAAMWIAHVQDSRKPLVTKPEQAYVVTQILEAIYESAKTGKPVYFD